MYVIVEEKLASAKRNASGVDDVSDNWHHGRFHGCLRPLLPTQVHVVAPSPNHPAKQACGAAKAPRRQVPAERALPPAAQR